MVFENLEKLLEEIEYLKESNQLLNDVSLYLDPYARVINGVECGSLTLRIHEHLNDFNDDE